MNISRAALIAGLAGILSVMLTEWVSLPRLVALESEHPQWWLLLSGFMTAVFPLILPTFYFALSRDRVTLHFSRRLRLVAAAAAVALGIVLLAGLPGSIRFLTRDGMGTVLSPEAEPWTIADFSRISAMLSNAALILLMVTIYRSASFESELFSPASKFLRVIARIAVVTWAVWVGFELIRLVASPFTYVMIRDLALRLNRTPPSLHDVVAEAAGSFLSQAALFGGPYVIWRAISLPAPEAQPTDAPIEVSR